MRRFYFTSLVLLFTLCFSSLQAQVFIRQAATGANNGTSWTDAYTDLQSALTTATAGTTIYVAGGTYMPTNTTDRTISFDIPDGVEVYGGFAGTETGTITQAILDARDFVTNETILSGDLNGDDNVTGTFPSLIYGSYGENSYHVVRTTNVSSATIVDGFTIKGGNADGSGINERGAGWHNDGSGTGNSSNPTLSNCCFLQNKANNGGGIFNNGFIGISSPTLTNCSFYQNNADSQGGGIFNNAFTGTSSPTLTNCSFYQNKSSNGGGIFNNGFTGISSPTFTNCTFFQNSANAGGGIRNSAANATIINSIFWGNTDGGGTNSFANNPSSSLDLSFSLIEEAAFPVNTTDGGNNILTQDPLFVDAPNGDFRLFCSSPAINVGNNTAIPASITTDINGNPRIQETTIDLGAYEGGILTQTEFFVNVATGSDTNGGTSFADAFATLRHALQFACNGAKIYVARGTYTPTNTTDRTISFDIPDGVEVYGGFAGTETGTITQAILDARDFVTNETILSGDLNGDDNVTGTFPSLVYGSYGENSYHVVRTTNTSSSTIINGFTIKGGNADGIGVDRFGAGWYNDGSGAGNSSNPTIINIIFSQNNARAGAGLYNSGENGGESNPTITNCTFYQNTVITFGGGVFSYGENGGQSSPNITNCEFYQNVANSGGGGVSSYGENGGESNPIITNCTLYQNTTNSTGGGLYISGGSSGSSNSIITNCTFYQNTAAIQGGGMRILSANSTVTNSIFWENTGGGSTNSFVNNSSSINLSNSLIEETTLPVGTTDGGNNILAQDPLFVDAPNDDFRLSCSSPAINVGNNTAIPAGVTTDINGNLRIQETTVDLGAYEGRTPTQPELFVNAATGSDANGGTSFADAFATLYHALPLACSGAKIYVATGTYTPTNTTDRNISFNIPDGVEVYGGFAGTETGAITQTVLDARDFITNETILSGDLNGDDNVTGTFPSLAYGNYAENSYHVVRTTNVSSATIVDGFTIKGGNAHAGSFPNNIGGGWYNGGSGAGNSSNPTLMNIIFLQNSASRGGGMYNNGASSGNGSPVLTNCIFSQNNANVDGGGIYNAGADSGESNPTITNCIFSQNNANTNGGGIYNAGADSGESNPTITNCIFLQNSTNRGGGIYNYGSSGTANPTFTNCTFYQNAATSVGGAIRNFNASSTVVNSVFWGNTDVNGISSFDNNPSSSLDLSFSLIEETTLPTSTTDGGNNILNQNPLFVDAASGDLRLSVCSPAINVGSNAAIPTGITTDIDGDTRIQETTIDLGAYEGGTLQPELFVNTATGSDSNTGTSFADAFATLHHALQFACNGAKIYVAGGTYTPTNTTDRNISFNIPDGVEVYGGFAGTETGAITQAVLDARDFTTNETILNGDLNGDDNVTGTFPSLVYGNYGENSYHVVRTIGVSSATIVDGFTIKGGNANGSFPNNSGGGWYNDGSGAGNSSNPTLINIIFSQNTANFDGSGIYNNGRDGGNSNPIITDCSFSQNNASSGGGMYNDGARGNSNPIITDCSFSQNNASFGGGIYSSGRNGGNSNPTITDCSFSQNNANFGGGMYNNGNSGNSSPILINCSFSQNNANVNGGGIHNAGGSSGESSPSITNCIFSQNNANLNGGGVYNFGSSGIANPTIANCTFFQNTASRGGAIRNANASSTVVSSIFWGNTDSSGTNSFANSLSSSINLSFSLIEETTLPTNTTDGGNNILAQDPLFVDASNGNLRLQNASPAIDKGNDGTIPVGVTTDISGNQRIKGTAVDMGAYESTPLTPTPPPFPAPATPTGLRASVISPTQVNLSWNGASSNVVEYVLYQNGVRIATLPAGTTSFEITGLEPDERYSFSLEAINRGFGQVKVSPKVSAQAWTLPLAPTLLETPTALCQGGQAEVALMSSSYNFRVYGDSTSNVVLLENTNGRFLLPSVSENTMFYIATVGRGGEEGERTAIEVLVEPSFEVSILGEENRQTCESSVALEALEVENADTYEWLLNGNLIPNQNGINLTATRSGSYKLRVKRGVCTFTSDEVNVRLLRTPVAAIAPLRAESFCEQTIISATDVIASASYTWSRDGQTVGEETSLVVSTSGTYILTVNQEGCQSSDTVSVLISSRPETPTLSITEAIVCPNGETTISIENPNSNLSYEWLRNGRPTDETGTSFIATQRGEYSVRATRTDLAGCSITSESVSFEFSVLETFYLRVSEEKTSLFLEELDGSQENIASVEWLFEGEVDASLGSTPQITPSEDGYYSAIITNQNGCRVRAARTVYFRVPEPIITGEEEEKESMFSVYPNPTTGLVNIQFESALTAATKLLVFDATGRETKSFEIKQGSKATQLDLSGLSKGVYTIQLVSKKNVRSISVVVD